MSGRLRRWGRLALGLVGVVVLLSATMSAPRVTPPLVAAELDPVAQPPEAPVDATTTQVTSAERGLDRISEQSHVAVSLLDEETGSTFEHGSGRFETASLVKVHLVALMSWQAAQDGTRLTASQRRDARLMLIRSDNDAALRTYFALGSGHGIERGLAAAYGRARINVGELGAWGHSVTRPRAVVALLNQVLDPDAGDTYTLLRRSMARVVPDQRWGISVLGDDGSTVETKVGWFQDPDGWIANSSGRVVVDGSPVLISVMSDRNPTLEAGIATVERVARLAGDVVRARRLEAPAVASPAREACYVAVPPISAC